MSAPERELKLSKRARRDFQHILAYTELNWGERQVFVYRDLIDEALEAIRRKPGIGHTHDALPDTHRVYSVGSHVVVYRERGDVIEVSRIVHKRMSLAQHV